MKIYLCDDELKMVEKIETRVKECLPVAEMVGFTTGTELLAALGQDTCDILLLDIDMPELNGMEVAERLSGLPQKPLLVFVTSHDELVYESFQYHPFGFVRKQFLDVELKKMLLDCTKELEQNKRYFNFHTSEGERCLLLSEIKYFESEGNYLKVYTVQGEHRFRSTIGAVEAALKEEGFLRIHKGFLVNQTVIRLFGSDSVKMAEGKSLPIGKTYAEEAKQQFMRYLRS